jgi:hypothetical protein
VLDFSEAGLRRQMSAVSACAHCGARITNRAAWFCSGACRSRAYRRRKAGLSEDAYRGGALRGSVPLDRRTRAETVISLITARPR